MSEAEKQAMYVPCVLTKDGFSEGCSRYNLNRKGDGAREAVNEFLIDSLQELADAVVLYADGRGDKHLTTEHLKVGLKSVRQFPNTLY
jgi:hypothetical protein